MAGGDPQLREIRVSKEEDTKSARFGCNVVAESGKLNDGYW